jgi:hypothetical protein
LAFQLQGDGHGARVSAWSTDNPLLQIAAARSLHFADCKLPETYFGAVPGSCAAARQCRGPYNATIRNTAISFSWRAHATESASGGRKRCGVAVKRHSSFDIATKAVSPAQFPSTTENAA